jgi:hypothetical protein
MESFNRLPVGLRFKMVYFAFIPGTMCGRKLSSAVKHLFANQLRFPYLFFACKSELEATEEHRSRNRQGLR